MTWRAYWLKPPFGEYLRVLLTPVDLLQLVKAMPSPHLVLATYRGDSLWVTGFRLATTPSVTSLDLAQQRLELDGDTFTFSPARAADVRALLARPMGTVPISRMESPDSDHFRAELEQLRALPLAD